MKQLYCWLTILSLLPSIALAQTNTQDKVEQETDTFIETIVEDQAEDSEVDNDTYAERLQDYIDDPINLNKARYSDLASLGLLNTEQIDAILEHREKFGHFLVVYELQSIPQLDLETCKRIAPFVRAGDLMDFNIPFSKLLFGGRHEIFTRYRRILEQSKGYKKLDTLADGTAVPKYLGSPDGLYARYRYKYGNKISYGITAEKDPGEPFFKGANAQGFDFYSAHFYLRDIGIFKHIALGDYELRLGQGLVAWSGLAGRKSVFIMNVPRYGPAVRPYTSVNEALFFRGAAATVSLGNWEMTAFGSWRKRDSNLVDSTDIGNVIATIDVGEGEVVDAEALDYDDLGTATSLLTSGLHRTEAEIKDKNTNDMLNAGGSVGYKSRRFSLGANAMYTHLSNALNPSDLLYNEFRFAGSNALNLSIDYKLLWRNVNFFGETAMSGNGAIASINGAIVSLDKRVFLSIAHRQYSHRYQPSPFTAAFAENSQPVNENGLFLGLLIKPAKGWEITAYADLYRSNWLRFKTDGIGYGHDYLAQVTWKPVREMEMYARFRYENKQQNAPNNSSPTDYLDDNERSGFRYQIDYKLTKAVRLRSRVEWSWYDGGTDDLNPAHNREQGFMVMQDLILKPLSSPFSMAARFALFDTDSYNTRIYAYENDVLYQFSIPPFYLRGSRAYFMLRYRVVRGVDVWLRYAQTFWANQNPIGSGNDEITGNQRSELKAMVRFSFK
ncbi:MAG: helix-hairpin-helix domain-containing protein [Chitinophagales bacterium]|nr:helix-hairpin-helix domain-containing protein [Chitinophagales bacterium]